MNYEEKYKKGISFLKDLKPHMSDYCIEKLEGFFPELRESEDEKIRKAQLDYWRSVGGKEWYGVPVQETIAWLEKQGEKLPVGFYYVNSEGKKFYSDTFKHGDVILHVEKQGEQPSWSEEDEEDEEDKQ